MLAWMIASESGPDGAPVSFGRPQEHKTATAIPADNPQTRLFLQKRGLEVFSMVTPNLLFSV
jgi:hypothetical protein